MSDATKFSTRLLGAFPHATDDDVRLSWDLAKGYDESVHAAAIDEHRLAQGGKIWRPDPRALVAICRRLAPGIVIVTGADAGRPESPLVTRTRAYLAQSRSADQATIAEWARADAILDGLTDDELAQHKSAALAASSDFVRRCLEHKDPRTDRRLKSLIVSLLAPAERAA